MIEVAGVFRSARRVLLTAALVLAGIASFADAQTTPPAQAPVSGVTPPAATATTPKPPRPVPSSSNRQLIGGRDEDRAASDVQSVDLAAQTVAMLAGKAAWSNGFKSLMDAFGKIRAEMAKADLRAAGRPLTVFVETDDQSFSYQAMIPVAGTEPGRTRLADNVTLATSPAGKAIMFQHRGAYDDIDATYEAITAYLDEKGLLAKNLFIEQYLNDTDRSDDPDLRVDIYVFVKD